MANQVKYNGDGHDFNKKGKVTSKYSAYHDNGKESGGSGNFSQKDAQLNYLTKRGKQGQSVSKYSMDDRMSREHTGNSGATAYNSRPIDQVYQPATSHGEPASEQIVYDAEEKKLIKGNNAV